jgi:hypothetical protein
MSEAAVRDARQPLLSGPTLRLCALRSLIAAISYTIVVEILVVLPSSWAVSAPRVLLYAFLSGLLFGPLTLLERWARHGDDDETLRAIAASCGILALAFAGGGLAWTQANYTAIALETGSLSKALAIVQSGAGPISRASALASVLFVTPPLGAAAGTYLRLRLSDRRGSLPAGLVTLFVGSLLISMSVPSYGSKNAAMLFAAVALSVPLVSYALADRLHTRWRRGGASVVD